MILCVANFFYYCYYRQVANELQQKSTRKHYITLVNAREAFIMKLEELKFIKSSQNIDPNNFDVIKDKNGMYLVSLIGSDGNNDHCVVLYNDLIFDSNEEFALRRNINNLNYCCSSVAKSSNFCKCSNVTIFDILTKQRKKKTEK